ncbi:MAG: Hpt domain-containing protein, partial [Myxococcota bacterium]
MSRREALIGRFRATALERVRKITSALVALEEGQGTAAQAQEVGRELHTIKGEARMLGFARLAEVVHAMETLFLPAKDGEGQVAPQVCARVRRGLEGVGRALRDENADEALAQAMQHVAGEAEAGPVPSTSTPTPE